MRSVGHHQRRPDARPNKAWLVQAQAAQQADKHQRVAKHVDPPPKPQVPKHDPDWWWDAAVHQSTVAPSSYALGVDNNTGFYSHEWIDWPAYGKAFLWSNEMAGLQSDQEKAFFKLLNESAMFSLGSGGKPPSLFTHGTQADVTLQVEGKPVVFNITSRGTSLSGAHATQFEVWAPAAPLLALKNSQKTCELLVRAVGTVVQERGLPRGLVEQWVGSAGFVDAIMAWLDGHPSGEDQIIDDLASML